jgi:hypothetical protein
MIDAPWKRTISKRLAVPAPLDGDHRVLVDDQQHALVGGLAPGRVVGEVLDQVAPERGGLVLEAQAVEQ